MGRSSLSRTSCHGALCRPLPRLESSPLDGLVCEVAREYGGAKAEHTRPDVRVTCVAESDALGNDSDEPLIANCSFAFTIAILDRERSYVSGVRLCGAR